MQKPVKKKKTKINKQTTKLMQSKIETPDDRKMRFVLQKTS